MENQRLILFVALSVVILLLWQAWQGDFGKQSQTAATAMATANKAPAVTDKDVPASPAQATTTTAPVITTTATPAEKLLVHGENVKVTTDTLQMVIDTYGGDLRQVDLLDYPVAKNQPDEPFRLLNDDNTKIFVAQSGLLAATVAPDHHALYKAAQNNTSWLQVPMK